MLGPPSGGGGKRVVTIAHFKHKHSRPESKSLDSKTKPDTTEGFKSSKSSDANIASDKSEAHTRLHKRVVTPADFPHLAMKSNWAAKANEDKGLTSNKMIVKTSNLIGAKTNPLPASNASSSHTAGTPPPAMSNADVWAEQFMTQCVPPFPPCSADAVKKIASDTIASRGG